jgi:hypothetical protein
MKIGEEKMCWGKRLGARAIAKEHTWAMSDMAIFDK